VIDPSPGLLIIAKAPQGGRAKTRLCPPCTPKEAALLAEAALRDTLAAVENTRVDRRVLVLDGDQGPWRPPWLEVIAQRGNGLDERLAAAFEDGGAPAVLIGMDTPQVTSALLEGAIAKLAEPGVDAVLGPAQDGGWWAIGLRRPDPAIFLGVPMGTARTASAQVQRLESLGLRWDALPPLRDVDDFADALAVAKLIPQSRFASAVGSVGHHQ
jgi:rSAM/selenodomain-associated transferase 1